MMASKTKKKDAHVLMAKLTLAYNDLIIEQRHTLDKFEKLQAEIQDFLTTDDNDEDEGGESKMAGDGTEETETWQMTPNFKTRMLSNLSNRSSTASFSKSHSAIDISYFKNRDLQIALQNNMEEQGGDPSRRRSSIMGLSIGQLEAPRRKSYSGGGKVIPADMQTVDGGNPKEKLKLRIESGYRMIIDDNHDDDSDNSDGEEHDDADRKIDSIAEEDQNGKDEPQNESILATSDKNIKESKTNDEVGKRKKSAENLKEEALKVENGGANEFYIHEPRRTLVVRRDKRRASITVTGKQGVSKKQPKNKFLQFLFNLPVIHPESNFRVKWNLLVLFMLLWYSFTIPFSISYSLPAYGLWKYIEILFDCLFGIDILLNTHTGYYSKKQSVDLIVMNKRMIMATYFSTWFLVDLVSIIPFDVIFLDTYDDDDDQRNLASFSKLIRLLKLFRLIRLIGMMRYFKYWSEHLKPGMLRLSSSILVGLLVIHVLACLFFYISDLNPNNVETWSNHYGVREDATFDKYVVSLYWSITTMTTVGYGDIIPQSTAEVLFVIFAMLVSCSMFAYFVGNMAHIIASVDSTQTLYKEKMEFVREYMSHQDLPLELQNRIKAYYAHCWKNLKSFPFSEVAIMEDLSPALRREVVLYLNKYMVEKVPFFQNQDENFICKLILVMVSEICAPLDFIIRQGEVGKCMYFIRRGLVEVCNKDASEVYTTLSDGAYFGEVSLLVGGRRTASVRAIFHCSLLRLEQEDLDEILVDYPDAMKHIVKLAATSKYQLTEAERVSLQNRFEVFSKNFGKLRNAATNNDEEKDSGNKGNEANSKSKNPGDDKASSNDDNLNHVESKTDGEPDSPMVSLSPSRQTTHVPLGASLLEASKSPTNTGSGKRDSNLRRSKTSKLAV